VHPDLGARLSNRLPQKIKLTRENSGAEFDHPLHTGTGPVHSWSSETLFELFDTTFNVPRTNGLAIAAPFMVLHSPLVCVEIGGMVSQIMLLQIGHNAPNPPHE